MRGPFHIAELNLVDPVLRIYIHRERYLQQPVQFFPLHHGFKFQSPAFAGQADVLRIGGLADRPGHLQNRFQPFFLNLNLYLTGRFHFLLNVVGINIPGIISARNIFI